MRTNGNKAVNGGNGNSNQRIMPLQNALGIENWPQRVQDECIRVAVNDRDRKFIPFEDFMIAGLDGKPLLNLWDMIGGQNITEQRFGAICDASDAYEVPDYRNEEEEDLTLEFEEGIPPDLECGVNLAPDGEYWEENSASEADEGDHGNGTDLIHGTSRLHIIEKVKARKRPR